MWDQVDTNKKAGALWPNDPDGNAWAAPRPASRRGREAGLQDRRLGPLRERHPGLHRPDLPSSRGRTHPAGVPIPPDFATFWKQAAQQGFQPKFVTIAKALLSPSAVEALGDLGHNLATEVWWTPSHPYSSSLTGQTAQQLADAYTAETGKQWTQPSASSTRSSRSRPRR